VAAFSSAFPDIFSIISHCSTSPQNNSVISLPVNFIESPIPEVLNISAMNSSETVVLKEPRRILSLQDTPPRSASIRKGPPVPIKIPNGRIHVPAVLVERDADLADLESHISVSIRAPKLPRKSTKRSKTREQPIKPIATPSASASASRRPSHASSLVADRDDVMTEASNDEFRFSLGFLLQPERSSVMTTRTGRADSATLPELSPFFASDNFIPPVPIIPPSLALSGANPQQHQSANSSEESLSLKNTSLSNNFKPLKQQRGSGMVGGMSPLASAYSQLTANSRPYNGGVAQDKRLSKESEEGDVTDYSPVFTAASPLDSPDRRHQQTGSMPLPAELKTPVKMSPALRRIAEEESPRSAASSKSDLDSPPIKSPGSPSHYSSTTPELSPSRKPNPPNREFSVLTPESGSSTSQDNSSDGFDIIQLPVATRVPPSLPSERRALPKSAVPMSAVSPGLSTGSIDGYLNTVIIENRPLINRIILDTPPAVSEGVKNKAAPSLQDAKKTDATFAPNHQKPPVAQGGEPKKLKFPPLEGGEFPAIIRPMNRERRPSLPSPDNTSHPGILERRPSAPSPLTGGPSAILFTPSSHQPLQAALEKHTFSGMFPFGSQYVLSSNRKQ
jgi:hypothetical protein